MSLLRFLSELRSIHVPASAPLVAETVADEIRSQFAPGAVVRRGRLPSRLPARSLKIDLGRLPRGVTAGDSWTWFDVDDRETARLATSHARTLYAFWSWLVETRGDRPLSRFRAGKPGRPTFRWQRPVWDLYLSQSGRMVENLDREPYVRQMARYGFTHLEVNSLASPEGLEEGVAGEVYPRFYTYGPALDQFVDSFLNRGVYPRDYLDANLERFTDGCRRAARYGLVPTITCFEPRSVPDALLAKYPELRGCRVDHPFRSFKPRYNLCVSHPVVRRHYREMMRSLMTAAPELGCLALWTNDSGAGFEFTRSLYVGANGSAYLVREWSDEDVFARAAADNVVGFLRLLRDAGRKVNPEFRVTTRLEPFTVEREGVLGGLGDGLDIEVPTLLAEGWDSPYRHPTYSDSGIGPFTVFNNRFAAEERPAVRRLARRNCRTHVVHAHGPVNNFEPLLGIPSPWLTREKLAALRKVGAEHLAHVGGVAPPGSVPFNVNEEVFRRFQFDPRERVDTAVRRIAASWAGKTHAGTLIEAWRLVEEAIRGFMPNPLYFSWGAWYRIGTRPLVPDIEAIPEAERAYYEDHVLTTHHNPTRFDLRRDVLFDVMSPAAAGRAVERNDSRALPRLDEALEVLEAADATAPVLGDLRDRVEALRCWMTTRRNVSAWIANVHGYRDTEDRAERNACRRRLREMVRLEIANASRLLALRRSSKTVFMAVSGGAETTFMYGGAFDEHLERKIDLMRRYGNRRPRIPEDVMYRVANLP